MASRILRTIALSTFGLIGVGSFVACGDDVNAKDCRVECDETQRTCTEDCDDDDCRTTCTTEFDDCAASCDSVKVRSDD